ncbi:cytochrome c maturation protein CcmE [Albidovulum sp.]
MSGLAKRRRIRLIVAAAALLALATVLIGTGLRDGIQFFRTPSEVLAAPPGPAEIFRIGGMVAAGSIQRRGSEVRFTVSDGKSEMAVVFEGITPDLFAEGEGVIATGRLVGGVVRAHEVLAKHDETYMPRELAAMGME